MRRSRPDGPLTFVVGEILPGGGLRRRVLPAHSGERSLVEFLTRRMRRPPAHQVVDLTHRQRLRRSVALSLNSPGVCRLRLLIPVGGAACPGLPDLGAFPYPALCHALAALGLLGLFHRTAEAAPLASLGSRDGRRERPESDALT